MTNDQEYRRRALAKIHIAKKELGLSDAEYRYLIDTLVPGKVSAADLSDAELQLHAAGAVKNPRWTALARFVKRMTGVGDLRKLTSKQAAVVVEALKKWLERT
jgi:phage gp16-like protein